MKNRKPEKICIGWREWIGFPELGVDRMKAKIDTGAKTSAIHAFRIKKTGDAEDPRVEFYLHPVQRRKNPEVRCSARLVDERPIKSSNGALEIRYVIVTPMKLGSSIWNVELTLTDRDQMGFRALVGRAAIRKRYIVDPSASFLMGQ